jgi:hypothetical protein
MTKVKNQKLIRTSWKTMLVIKLKARILFKIFNLKNCTAKKYILDPDLNLDPEQKLFQSQNWNWKE